MASTIADAQKIKKIIALVNNLYTSKFNSGAIIGIIKFIEKSNPKLTNTANGIALILQYDCHYLEIILRLIIEYVSDFVFGFYNHNDNNGNGNPTLLLSRQKCLILIIAYLANYNNYYDISCINVALDIEANLYQNLNQMRLKFGEFDIPLKKHADILRDWYNVKYRESGFILWEDPIVGNLDEFIA